MGSQSIFGSESKILQGLLDSIARGGGELGDKNLKGESRLGLKRGDQKQSLFESFYYLVVNGKKNNVEGPKSQ